MSKEELTNTDQLTDQDNVSGKAGLTNAERELEADAKSNSKEVKRISYAGLIVRRFFRQRSAVIGLIIIGIMVLIALFGKYLTPYNYQDADFAALAKAPNANHWFGTDGAGIDLYACVVHGLGRSLTIGISYAVLTTIISAIIGTAIAYVRGIPEKIGMWLLDMLMVIPSFLLVAMIVRAAGGESGWLMLIFGLTAFGWIGRARTLRTMGVSPFTIIVRHLIPNLGSILIIDLVLAVIGGINSETAFSFLGLGIKAPDTSLGYLLSAGSSAMLTTPWMILIPSVFLIIVCVGLQLIGDGLRDAFDPYSRAAGSVKDQDEDNDAADESEISADMVSEETTERA